VIDMNPGTQAQDHMDEQRVLAALAELQEADEQLLAALQALQTEGARELHPRVEFVSSGFEIYDVLNKVGRWLDTAFLVLVTTVIPIAAVLLAICVVRCLLAKPIHGATAAPLPAPPPATASGTPADD